MVAAMLELNVHSVQLGGYPGRDTTVRVIYDSKFVEYSLAKNQSAKLSLPTGSYIEVAGAHPADRKPWTQTLTAENLARVQSGCFAGGVFFFEVCEKRGPEAPNDSMGVLVSRASNCMGSIFFVIGYSSFNFGYSPNHELVLESLTIVGTPPGFFGL